MAYNWSDPYSASQGISPAEAMSRINLPENSQAAQILMAIGQRRYEQQQQVQQAVAQGIGGLMAQRQRDQIANSLLAQMQAPRATPVTPGSADYVAPASGDTGAPPASPMQVNAALGYPTTPAATPNLGGEMALNMQLQTAKNLADLNMMQAHANYFSGRAQGGYGGTPIVDPNTGMVWNGRQWVRGPSGGPQGVADRFALRQSELGWKNALSDLNRIGGLTKPQGTKITEATFNDPTQIHEGTGPQGENIPEGYYGIGGNSLQTIVPKDQFNAARGIYDQYQATKNRVLGGGGGSTAAPTSIQPGMPSVGTTRTINGVPSTWNGQAWVAQ